MSNSSAVAVGSILEKRYRILQELGQGGFGRTYLAEDMNRYNETCVLKEFAPHVLSVNDLQKAQELFEREAGMLYKLEHPQIPRFRELIWVNLGVKDSLFLVQDYIAGQSYWDLLNAGHRFSEANIIELLRQVLPILDYIHSQNIIHRDISPDNLIQRQSDHLPFLIDFGCVKQMAVNALSQYTGLPGTVVGKNGYAPEEQMRQGKVSASSDLYALAVTALVLLSGEEPQYLYNSFDGTWCWQKKVSISPELSAILNKMLAYRTRDRYLWANEVRQALEAIQPSPAYHSIAQGGTVVASPGQNLRHKVTSFIQSKVGTVVVAPGQRWRNRVTALIQKKQLINKGELRIFATSTSIVLVIVIGTFALAKSGLKPLQLPQIQLPSLPNQSSKSEPTVAVSSKEQARLEKILQRRQRLKIDALSFNQTVDRLFYNQHPELQGRSLTNQPDDTKLRNDWCRIAEQLLDQLEQG